jgi:DNA-directed RNA polymerase subunit RPC12/RpoP
MAEPAGGRDEDVVTATRLPDEHVVPVDLAPRKSRWEPVPMPEEPSAEERAAERQAARLRFRAYCIACGRSTESATPPSRPGRCSHCGGTMLVEPVTS